MIGRTISHYKILDKLGEGGMGIVYKAQDLTLNRLVALKFLPHHLMANEAEQARFLQEGQAASALNHPNVCIIYELSKDGDQQFIAMEFIDGATLREKFRSAPLKLNDAITYALQIGDALSEAHSKGIVHRDIKSDNIMVNAKNQIKVMDFGLAKLKGSLKLTRASSTVGTLSYMAPEQIQGNEADARSDIFSFGVVVFELLTQRTPFRGEHEAAILYSILNEPPEPLEKYRSDTSPDLVRILNRALEKDPEDRYQSVADMVSELRRLKKETSRVSHVTAKIPVQQSPAARQQEAPSPERVQRKSLKALWISLAVAIPIVAGGIIFSLMKFQTPSNPLPPENSSAKPALTLNANMAFRTLQVPLTEIGSPGISTDGNWTAFPAADVNGKWDVYYMNMSGGDMRRVTSDSSRMMTSADLSPDGSKIVYDRWNDRTGRLEVCVVSSFGGASTVAAEMGSHPRWRPDGQRIGCFAASPPSGKVAFQTVSLDGSDRRIEFVDESSVPGNDERSFCWSPDGKSIAFARLHPDGFSEIFAHDLTTGKEQQVTFDRKHVGDVSWSHGDDIVYASDRGGNVNLWATTMLAANARTPVQLTKGSGPDLTMRIAPDGKKLIYLQRQQAGHIFLADSSGALRQVTFDERDIRDAATSPDGKLIACVIADPNPLVPTSHLYVMNRDGSVTHQITKGDEIVGSPRWSSDGRWIAFSGHAVNESDLQSHVLVVDVDGSAAPRMLREGKQVWWLDGENLLVFSGARSWLTTIHGGESEMFFEDSTLAIPVSRMFPRFHGDVDLRGDFVLYRDLRHGREGWWMAFAPRGNDTTNSTNGSSSFVGPPCMGGLDDAICKLRDSLMQNPRRLLPASAEIALVSNGMHLYYQNEANEVWQLSLPWGISEHVHATIPARQVSLNAGFNEGEFIYVDSRLSAKLILVESVFQ